FFKVPDEFGDSGLLFGGNVQVMFGMGEVTLVGYDGDIQAGEFLKFLVVGFVLSCPTCLGIINVENPIGLGGNFVGVRYADGFYFVGGFAKASGINKNGFET